MHSGSVRLALALTIGFIGITCAAQPNLDQTIKGTGNNYTISVPANWTVQVNTTSIEASGDGIDMVFLTNTEAVGRFFMGFYTNRDWTGVTKTQEDGGWIGGTPATVNVFRGLDDQKHHSVRRETMFSPTPADQGKKFFNFHFQLAESDYARRLDLMKAIEHSFRSTAAGASAAAVGPVKTVPPAPLPSPSRTASQPPVPARVSGPPPRFEPWISPSKAFTLSKPSDWVVKEDTGDGAFSITVTSPDHASEVNMLWVKWPTHAVVKYVALCESVMGKPHPGFAFTKVWIAKDGNRGVAETAYPVNGVRSVGRAYFESNGQRAVMQEYAAPQQRIASDRPIMMNIVASVAFIHAPKGAGAAAAGPPPFQIPLSPRRADDGSWALQMPADWQATGAQGRILAGKPGGGMGFIFTAFTGQPGLRVGGIGQGMIASLYMPPDRTLLRILGEFGHHNQQVVKTIPDPEGMKECSGMARNGCDAAIVLAKWTSKGGANCLGAFKLINLKPGAMGTWSTTVAGIWAPQEEFARYLPTLEAIGKSFQINGQFASQYVARGLENLRILEGQTAQAMADLRYAAEDKQRAWEQQQERKEFTDSQWDDYSRGNSYWVSDLENGKVYHTDTWGTRDTQTGDYYEGRGYNWTNFEGQNPNYPSEDMHEVTRYELEHGGVPK